MRRRIARNRTLLATAAVVAAASLTFTVGASKPPPATSPCGGPVADNGAWVCGYTEAEQLTYAKDVQAQTLSGATFATTDNPDTSSAITDPVGDLTDATLTGAEAPVDATPLVDTSGTVAAALPGDGGYACTSLGCFHRTNYWQMDFAGKGYYGITYSDGSRKQLGTLEIRLQDSINCRQTTTQPQYAYSTRSIGTWKWGDERYYLSSSYPGGHSLDPRAVQVSAWGGLKSAGLSLSYAPVYLEVYKGVNVTAWQTNYHVLQFRDPVYSSFLFYVKVKSFKMKLTTDGTQCYRYDYLNLPSTATSIGAL